MAGSLFAGTEESPEKKYYMKEEDIKYIEEWVP